MKKRLLALALALVMAVGLCPAALAADEVRETDFFQDQPHTDLNFEDIQYREVDADAVLAEMDVIRALAREESGTDEAIRRFEWVAEQYTDAATMYVFAQIQTNADGTSETWAQAYTDSYSVFLELTDAFNILVKELLETPLEDWLLTQLAPEQVDEYRSYSAMTEEQQRLLNEEAELIQEYSAAAMQDITVEYQGEQWGLAEINQAGDGGIIDADTYDELILQLYRNQNAVLGEIYLRLVALRGEIARSFGYDTYNDYAYDVTFHRDYTPEEVGAFVQAVAEYIAPITVKLGALEQMNPDDPVLSGDYTGDVAIQMVRPYLDQMSSELGEAMDYMVEHNLYDLDESPVKQEIGYTISLYSYGAPYMSNCPYNDFYDFCTLVHEFGHYNNAYWDPMRWNTAEDYADVAEVHSQGMELLMTNFYGELFGDSAQTTMDYVMLNLIVSMTQGCMYGELERYAYDTPGVTLQQLNEKARELAEELGFIDMYIGGQTDEYLEHWYNVIYSNEWVTTPHLFQAPSYFISYATSAAGAFAFWVDAQTGGFTDAVDDYLAFVAQAPGMGLLESFEAAGMDNPMEESYLRELAETLNTELRVDQRLAGTSLEGMYTDVDPEAWYVLEVAKAIAAGLMQGTSDTTFSPDDDTTRGQLVTMLYRMDGEPELEGNLGYPFEDVAPDTWYTDAVYWARDNGIVQGYSDAQFAPGDPITREQLAAMLYRYAQYKDYDVTASGDLSGYADGDAVSGWAEEAMSWSVDAGLIRGDENGLTPAGTAIRAQTAAILVRLLELYQAD